MIIQSIGKADLPPKADHERKLPKLQRGNLLKMPCNCALDISNDML